MSLIVEGVDGTGKTTFSGEWLVLNNEYIYMHNYVKPDNERDRMSECAKELLITKFVMVPYIMDRSFIISEYVYATVLGRKTNVTLDSIKLLIDTLNDNKDTLVLCTYHDYNSLIIKPEDKWLPHDELNRLYMQLFTKEFKVHRLMLRYIEEVI